MTCRVTGSTNDIKIQTLFSPFEPLERLEPLERIATAVPVVQTFQSFHVDASAACLFLLLHNQIPIIIHCRLLLRMNHCRGIQLFDYRWAGNLVSRLQETARVDRAVQYTMLFSEVDFPLAGLRFINSSSGRLCRRKLRLGHETVGNQPQTDQLHRLAFRLMAGSLFMLCVEALPHQIEI